MALTRDADPGAVGLDPARLRGLLKECRFGARLRTRRSVTSTNDVARQLGRNGEADATVIIAEEQTAGRGRRGRRWHSPPAGGIYASALLRPESLDSDYAAGLQLAAGVAVCDALERWLPTPPELLWPNDCVCRGAKIAGILVESESRDGGLDFLVCGMGVNVNQSAGDLDPDLIGLASSVRMLRDSPADLTRVTADLLVAFDRRERQVRGGGVAAIMAAWARRSPTVRGHEVEVETLDGRVRGASAGLSEAGALRVDTGDGVREISVGELIKVRRKV